MGLNRSLLVQLTSVLVLGMGAELWARFIPKYLESLGAGVWVIAVYGALLDLLDPVYQYPGGWLADRLGRRRTLVLFTLAASLGYGLYLLSSGWGLILLATFFVAADSFTVPALYAGIADNLPAERRGIGFGIQSIWKRLPSLVAPPVGGWLVASLGLAAGTKLGLGINMVLAWGSAALVRLGYSEAAPAGEEKVRFLDTWRAMSPGLKRLLLADCLARLAEGGPKVFIVLYVLDHLRLSAFQFGWLIGLQYLTALVLYVPLAKLADRIDRRLLVLVTFAFFAVFPLALALAPSLAWVMVAFVLAGLREVGEPARKALIMDQAEAAARGRTVGLYFFLRGLAVFPAALLGGWLWTVGPRWPFYMAFLVGAAGFVVYALAEVWRQPAPRRAGADPAGPRGA